MATRQLIAQALRCSSALPGPQAKPLQGLPWSPMRLLHLSSPVKELRSEQTSRATMDLKKAPISTIGLETSRPQTSTSHKLQAENFSTSQNKLGKIVRSPTHPSSFEFFSVRSLISTPFPYMAYGLGGLIPFMGAPVYMQLAGHYSPFVAQAQLVYGACILSFLGGVAWGEHLSRSDKSSLSSLQYSIFLPLIAWPSVLLYPSAGISSFAVIISGVLYAGFKDTQNQNYPRWFRNMRFLLTLLVATSLSTTVIFRFSKKSADSVMHTKVGNEVEDDAEGKNESMNTTETE